MEVEEYFKIHGMNKILQVAVIGILFFNNKTYSQSIEAKFQEIVDSIYSSNQDAIGIMVSIKSPEKGISWSGAVGYSDFENKTELEPDQPALIASNTKTFVSATILRLVEMGKLSIEQPIQNLLTPKTRDLFEGRGYRLDSISVKHLLSHTSGIENFANGAYIDFITKDKNHRWTRDEQLELTVKAGPPLGSAETVFSYSDANYLLLTEIIEGITKQPFYTAMRELLNYESLSLQSTWFPTLEAKPSGSKPLVHQYWGEQAWDSRYIDVSVDLFGGGGIACSAEDLAGFIYDLFNHRVIEDTSVFKQIFTTVPTKDSEPGNYYLGLTSYEYKGMPAYGHGGFWGTRAVYFPDLETSMAVYVLERDKRGLINELIAGIVGLLKE